MLPLRRAGLAEPACCAAFSSQAEPWPRGRKSQPGLYATTAQPVYGLPKLAGNEIIHLKPRQIALAPRLDMVADPS